MWLNNLFLGVFNNSIEPIISLNNFLLCIGVSLAIGLFLALTYTYKTQYTKSFVVTLATLPTVVCVVIMMVNGNLGTGVAVAGTFSLIRFRSLPGTAKELGAIFLAMGAGLMTGMGYLGYGVLFILILCTISTLYSMSPIGEPKDTERTMQITIPEDLNYAHIFEDIFSTYTKECNLLKIKTRNMGSLFKLTYHVILKSEEKEKEFIDEIRCRNGNLEITMAKQSNMTGEL